MTNLPTSRPSYPFPLLGFPDWLELVEDRSAALRKAVEAAGLGAQVPGCPDWAVRDLVAHVGQVQRFWAAVVAAGPAATPPAPGQAGPGAADADDPASPASPASPADPGVPADALLAWSARSTALLLDGLQAAGPDRGCWTWWSESDNPATSGAVARHQVQEAAMHARDAQEAAGSAEPLPPGLAVDAVDEFLHVGFGSMDGWPHSPSRVALVADEGPAWTLILDSTGASAVRGGPGEGPEPGAVLAGPAGELLLALYRRTPLVAGTLRIGGDQALLRQLVVWSPLG